MKVQIWHSFSCNNSSSNYLVGTFESAEAAEEAAKALPAHFEELSTGEDFYLWPEDEEPGVWVAGDKVVVYHGYCGGLYEVDLVGATARIEEEGSPRVGVNAWFAEGKEGDFARKQLTNFFAQGETETDVSEWSQKPPWSNYDLAYAEAGEDVFFWTDGSYAAFTVRFREELDGLKRYLERPGFSRFELLLCDEAHRDKLHLLSMTKTCIECDSSALTLKSADDSIDEDQLICSDCGGMFSLSTLAACAPIKNITEERLVAIGAMGGELVAAGDRGAIFRQSGATWTEVGRVQGDLTSLAVIDERTAFVTGLKGGLFRTDDSGSSWRSVRVSTSEHIRGVARGPSGSIWVCGDRGVLLRSDDDGTRWKAVHATRFDIRGIAIASESLLYACCRFGKVLCSRDGGANWDVTQSPTQRTLNRIALAGSRVVIVGDRGVTLIGSGVEWELVMLDPPSDIHDCRADGDRVLAVTSDGRMIELDDQKWTTRGDVTGQRLFGLERSADGEVFAVGASGLVARFKP